MTTATKTHTKTDRHAIIACEAKSLRLVVLSVHPSYDAALDAYAPLDDARYNARVNGQAHNVEWYAVRSVEDPLVVKTICAQFKLGPRQAAVLKGVVAAARPGHKATTTEVYNAGDAWRAIGDFSNVSQVAKRLADRGLVTLYGVAYGPKTYRPTALGRLLSEARRGTVGAQS